MQFRVWMQVLGVALSVTLACSPALAGHEVPISIRAQPVDLALREFTIQSGLQVLFPAGSLEPPFVTRQLEGVLTPESALRALLSGSGLGYEFVNNRTVAIRAVADGGDIEKSQSAEGDANPPQKKSRSEVQAGGVPRKAQGIPEVLVEGSRSLNADIERTRDDVQPYVVMDRESIRRSGASNIEDLLRSRLTMNYSPNVGNFTQNLTPQLGAGNRSRIALRGLSASQTLILIDGRRTVSGSLDGTSFQPDLNAIPLSAIERIEVLPATASGIYGGSAVGGVVNVVLRRDFTGVDVGLDYGSSFRGDGGNRGITLNSGTRLFGGRTTILLSANYSDTSPIRAGDRRFIAEYRQRRYENSNRLSGRASSWTGATTNVQSNNGSNLVLKSGVPLNSPVTFAPYGYAGRASDAAAALIQNAGKQNFDLAETSQPFQARADIAGSPIVRSANLTLRQQLTPETEVFLEFATSKNSSYIDLLSSSASFTLLAQDPGNPFRQTVFVQAPIYTDNVSNVTKTGNRRNLLGVKTKLGSEWRAELDFVNDRYNFFKGTAIPSAFVNSPNLLSDVKAGVVDIFKDDRDSRVLSNYLRGANVQFPTHSIQNTLSARLAGPFMRTAAGSASLSAVTEFRDERNTESGGRFPLSASTYSESRFSEQSARNYSVYLEAVLPLVSEQNQIPWVHSFDVQLAGRHERYHQVAGYSLSDPPASVPTNDWHSTDPTLGIRFRPVRDITLRASFGTGFLPPGLTDLVPLVPMNATLLFGSFDPKRGNEPVENVLVSRGGNPDLLPEESSSKSVGIIFNPRVLEELRVSVDWTKIRKRNNITSIFFDQTAINNEDFLPGLLTRGVVSGVACTPVCPIIAFDSRLINNANAETESYDVSLDYLFSSESWGDFAVSATGTRLLHNMSQLSTISPWVESAGLFSAPSWRAVASLDWRRGGLGVSWNSQYLDSYWARSDHAVEPALGSDRVGSIIYHDIAFSYQSLGATDSSAFLGLELRAGVRNVFDTAPRFSSIGLYDPWGSPVLRSYYVSLRKQL